MVQQKVEICGVPRWGRGQRQIDVSTRQPGLCLARKYSKASALETTGEGSFVCEDQRWRHRSKRRVY